MSEMVSERIRLTRHVEPHECPREDPSSACDFNRFLGREAEAYAAGRLAGLEDGLSAAPAEGLTTLAAYMIRQEGGCESGHKPGQWHMHEDAYFAIAQRVASHARAALAAPAEGLDVERLARALNVALTYGWLRSTPPDPVEEWRMNARLIAREYAALDADR